MSMIGRVTGKSDEMSVIAIIPEGSDTPQSFAFNIPYVASSSGKTFAMGATEMVKNVPVDSKVEFSYGTQDGVKFLKFIKILSLLEPMSTEKHTPSVSEIKREPDRQHLIMYQTCLKIAGSFYVENSENIDDGDGAVTVAEGFVESSLCVADGLYFGLCKRFKLKPEFGGVVDGGV